MRVLQVSKFYPPVLGGIESVAWELVEGLNRAGVRTDVICANQGLRTTHEDRPAGYVVWRAGSWGTVLSTSVSPSMIGCLWKMNSCYDILHVHMPDPMAAVAVWASRPRAKIVVHWHSDIIRQRKALKLYEPLQNWMLQRADAIVATSEPYLAASPPLQAWRHKVAVIPIGISDNRKAVCGDKAAAIRQQYRGRRIIFSVGRMTYYKGFDVLVEAADWLPPDCAVLVGGEGSMFDFYRSASARRGLAGKVHFLGHISDDDLPSYFEACDIYCMPSTVRSEAYGVAMLEAMVMGKPIVATDISGSGVPWVNIDGVTGVNVPVGRASELAAALVRLLDDTALRERLGHGARERYLRDFTAPLMTQRMVDLYQRLASAI